MKAAQVSGKTSGVMTPVDSPTRLFERLVALFPSFLAELQDEEIESYHQVVTRLTPVITGYLRGSPDRTLREFCHVVNLMVDAGGDRENAISTCFLEHASQVGVAKLIRSHLGKMAKKELR